MWFGRRGQSPAFKLWIDYPDKYDFPTCWVTNIDDVDLRFDAGKPITRRVPDKIVFEVDKNLPLLDLMRCEGEPLVSDRLAELISRMSSCATFYDSEVQFHGEVLRADCKAVNFTTSFPCLDMQKSKFSEIGLARRIVIDKTKIPAREHIYRPSEYVASLFVDQAFIDEVQALGITGTRFERP